MKTALGKKNLLVAGLASIAFVGCGGGSDAIDPSAAVPMPMATDIRVERGPLLGAMIVDAGGRQAVHLGNGVYRFASPPTYPIVSVGGFIDLDRSGVVDAGDIKAGALTLKSGQSGLAMTLGSTLAGNPELLAALTALGFTETQLLNHTPSQDRMIAALSDELYKFAVTRGIGDVSTLSAQVLADLSSAIQARIEKYKTVLDDAATLEQQLVAELSDSVDTVNADEATELASATSPEMLVSSLPVNLLSDEQKATLSYMWNEEKMAKDVYLALNAVYPGQQLYNIATNAETRHQAAVEALLKKYNLNVEDVLDPAAVYSAEALAAIAPGIFTLPVLQNLYDSLYSMGVASARASLEVGCMVEVTDVNDLDRDILLVANLADVKAVFENLRAGSYSHYWAFDSGLKSIGVSAGCCSLGGEYCHPEYPNTSAGQGLGGQYGRNR